MSFGSLVIMLSVFVIAAELSWLLHSATAGERLPKTGFAAASSIHKDRKFLTATEDQPPHEAWPPKPPSLSCGRLFLQLHSTPFPNRRHQGLCTSLLRPAFRHRRSRPSLPNCLRFLSVFLFFFERSFLPAGAILGLGTSFNHFLIWQVF